MFVVQIVDSVQFVFIVVQFVVFIVVQFCSCLLLSLLSNLLFLFIVIVVVLVCCFNLGSRGAGFVTDERITADDRRRWRC